MSFIEGVDASRWVPLLRIDEYSWLGLARGVLSVGNSSDPKRAVDPAAPIGLLPLLERSRGEVFGEVERCERELGLPVAALTSRVPLDQIPRIALATNMDYWARRALDWMDGGTLTADDEEVLLAAEHAAGASQSVRQHASRLRRSIRATPT